VNHTNDFSSCLDLSTTYEIWNTRPDLYIFTKERQEIQKIKQLRTKGIEARLRQSICEQVDIAVRLSPEAITTSHKVSSSNPTYQTKSPNSAFRLKQPRSSDAGWHLN
jgi:hypothetical protein